MKLDTHISVTWSDSVGLWKFTSTSPYSLIVRFIFTETKHFCCPLVPFLANLEQIMGFWFVTSCSLQYYSTLKMRAVRSSETMVNSHDTTRRHNPEDYNRHIHPVRNSGLNYGKKLFPILMHDLGIVWSG
jgi:hypothetical protein